MNINLCISLVHITIHTFLSSFILYLTFYNIQPPSFLLQNTIHTIDISFTNTFPSNTFQEKKKKKSTFPIQLHPLYLFLTFFSKPIYINNRRNCFKNRFNFHRKLIPSVILTLSYQPLRANQSSRWKMAAKQGNSFETSRGIYLFIVYSSTARGRFLFRSVILEDFGPARGSTCTGWKRAKLFLFAL